MNQQKVYKILTILLVAQWAFIKIIGQYPSFVEIYYSNGLYIFISRFLRFVFGWIPFSMGDLLYLFFLYYILKNCYFAVKRRKIHLKNTFFKIGAMLSIVFFLFQLNWGINYLRQPLAQQLNLEKNTYNSEELMSFTNKLIARTNRIHVSIVKNDTALVENKMTKAQIKAISSNGFEQLELKNHFFKYQNQSVKHSLISIPLTYMGFAGYLNPITNEAQVNSLIPKNSYPATLCHEIAHQLGYASESEANFLGFLASVNAEDIHFKYSGYLMALRYCLFEIRRHNPEDFKNLKGAINVGILKDMQRSQEFWRSYQNWSEKYFKIFYDSYLKANKQKEGIKSYNKMVALIINYYKTEPL
jgi:hypothetical protein